MGLVLQRKANESIWVGDIEIAVTRISCGKVWLWINAPQEVPVDRDEVRQRKIQEQQESMRDHDDE